MKKNKIILLLILLSLFISAALMSGFTVYNKAKDAKTLSIQEDAGYEVLKKAVIATVAKGDLSKEKADRLLAFWENSGKEAPYQTKRMPYLDKKSDIKDLTSRIMSAVDAGIINTTEAKAILCNLKKIIGIDKMLKIENTLEKLVQDKTITKEQKAAIISYLNTEKEKCEKMTPDERREYIESRKKSGKKPLFELVEDSTLTAEQAEAVRKALRNIFIHKP